LGFFLGLVFPALAADTLLDQAARLKESGDYPAAIKVLETGQSVDSKSNTYLGWLYYLNGESAKALSVLNSLPQKDWLVHLYLGFINEDLGGLEAAQENYRASLADSVNTLSAYRLGKIYLREKKYQDAAIYFSQAIVLDPSISLAQYYLAQCCLVKGEWEDAYNALVKSDNAYPGNPAIKQDLELVKARLGEGFFTCRQKEQTAKRAQVTLKSYIRRISGVLVRVGIGTGLKQFTFRGQGQFTIGSGKKEIAGNSGVFYTIKPVKSGLAVYSGGKKTALGVFSSPLRVQGKNYPFYVLDVSYGKGNFWNKQIDRIYRGDLEVALKNNNLILINSVSMEDYLYGVLPAEISAQAPEEALRAQAVAARSIAFSSLGRHKKDGFDLCADVHCQVYQGMSVEKERTNQAVDDTSGRIMVYAGKPVYAYYHSNSGGCVRSDVYGKQEYAADSFDTADGKFNGQDCAALPGFEQDQWLATSPDTFSAAAARANYRWQRVYDAEDFVLAFGYPLTDLKSLVPIKKGGCFHYEELEVKTIKGSSVIKGDLQVRDYLDKLRSSAFKIDLKTSGSSPMLLIWGAGFGHGGGMSQAGAATMAAKGYSWQDILKHYYPGATLEKKY